MAIFCSLCHFLLLDRRDARICCYLSFLSLFDMRWGRILLLLWGQTSFWLCAAFGVMRGRICHFFDQVLLLLLFRLFSFLYRLYFVDVFVEQHLVVGGALDAWVNQIERLCRWSVVLVAAVPAEKELTCSLRCRWLGSIQVFHRLALFLLFFKLAFFESPWETCLTFSVLELLVWLESKLQTVLNCWFVMQCRVSIMCRRE